MNYEDMIREEYVKIAGEDDSKYAGKKTITALTSFVEVHLQDAKSANNDNDPGATRDALVKAGGALLYALREHGHKWHLTEDPPAAHTRILELEKQLAHEKRQEQGYKDAIGDLQVQTSKCGWRIEELEKERDDFSSRYDDAHHEIDRLMGIEAEHEDEIHRLEKEIEEQKADQQRLLAKITCLENTNSHDLSRAIDLLRRLVGPEAQRAAIPLSVLAQNAIDRIEKLEAKPDLTIEQRLEQLANLELEVANAYATRATDDFAEVEARCWDLQKAKGHYRRREQLMQEWSKGAER